MSCVLEYVDDLKSVWSELQRVSGGHLYVVHIKRSVLEAKVLRGYVDVVNKTYFKQKHLIMEAPPAFNTLKSVDLR